MKEKKVSILRTKQPDYWLIVSVAFLLAIGTIMVFSSSTVSSYLKDSASDSYSILTNHFWYLIGGLVIMVIAALVSYRVIEKLSLVIYLVSFALVGLVLIPGIGKVVNSARRWIYIGPVSFQPSELLKIGTIVFLAYIFTNEKMKELVNKKVGFLIYLLPIGVSFYLLYKEPHASCIIIIGAVAAVMLLVAKEKLVRMIFYVGAAILAGVGIYFTVSHVQTRINAHFGLATETTDDLYQITQSLYAIGSGGLSGRGLGNSVQKYQYLPEPYNDFIFSILAEELGFLGVLLVLVLFGILFWRGYKIAICAPDKYSSLLATGITTLLAVQTVMNLMVVSKIIPVTGVALPFFSYGGTSLIMIMGEVGILIGISVRSNYAKF